MASNGVKHDAASSGENATTQASPVKASGKKEKGHTLKLKKPPVVIKNPGNWHESEVVRPGGDKRKKSTESTPSPVMNEMDDKIVASFPTGRPLEDEADVVVCKHCKKGILKPTAASHIRNCIKQKQEKLKKKKEAKEAKDREAKEAKEKEAREAREAKEAKAAEEKGKDADGDTGTRDAASGKAGEDGEATERVKSAKKSAATGEAKGGDDGPKKSKKRKADADADKGPKAKKKKEEPKAKVAKPKGPVDVEKQCGVPLANGAQCARSLTCKSHSMGAKRGVPGRSLPYDMLLSVYQKKNQAKQQKAAIDANAPLQDEMDSNAGPVDSDEEKDAIMAAIARSRPQPLESRIFVPTRRKYQYIRMKGLLSGALGGSRGGGLFSTGDAGPRGMFAGDQASGGGQGASYSSSPVLGAGSSDASGQRLSLMQQAVSGQNRAVGGGGGGGGGGGMATGGAGPGGSAQRKASTPTIATPA
ncbi:MAG: Dcp1p-Dcp2p decapping enzyme complex alpha subunit [Thelocarpon impressellum]|nr:MAG: Dcp1p-Dcp2p decapping enzyme complex alpha subunit [Thelocarpon impressellum]